MRCRASASRPRELLSPLYVERATRFTVAYARPLCSLRTTCTRVRTVLFDGNSIAKVCRVTSERSGGGDWRSKADARSRERTIERFARLLFVDVLVTQLGELCGERVFVGEAAQIEDERVVLYASNYRNR